MYLIHKITSNCTVDYAAEELKKYLRMMMPEGGDVAISYAPEAKDGFRLGLMQDFGLDVSDVQDPELDDILYIDCGKEGGIIAGDNPRSVLLAVYEYLRQNGCRWLYPGVDGEYIPMQSIQPVKYRFVPSCRYRAWSNDGAQYQSCLLEDIEFLPKVGMNAFMIQFINPVILYNHFYNHRFNEENYPPECITPAQSKQWTALAETELQKRGIRYHAAGHGFTSIPFGFDETADVVNDADVPPEVSRYFAMIDGKRGIFRNSALCTNFCMSNPEARKIATDYVVSLLKKRSSIDYLHVWLADLPNNHCECEDCQKSTPSDLYVLWLNEIDEALTRQGIATRIVFIAYLDSLWAPVQEKLKNQDRFTMLIAPITRKYTTSVPDGQLTFEPLPYQRNQNVMPSNLEEYLAYYLRWCENWKGDNVSFEYHFWLHQYLDISGIYLSRLIHEDVRGYKKCGIDGIIPCGSQRCFFPSGLAFYTFARTLYDTSLSADEIMEDYFSHIYGKDWKQFYDYLDHLHELLPFSYMTLCRYYEDNPKLTDPEQVEKLKQLKPAIAEGRKLIKSHYNSDVRVQTVSVRLLEHHADLYEALADAIMERAKGNILKSREMFDTLRKDFGKREPEIKRYFDHFIFTNSLNRLFADPPKTEQLTN